MVVLPIAKSEGEEIVKLRNIYTNSQNIKLLKSEMSPSLTGPTGGADVVIEDNALLAMENGVSGEVGENPQLIISGADEISVYVVREGDTISQIAEMYGVKINTIKGFNNIKTDKDLNVGEELLILPIDGALHKVVSGDTLASLAKKYKSDEADISLFNDIPTDGKLAVGSEIVIPNAEPLVVETPKAKVGASTKTTTPKSTGGVGTSYPAGFYTHPIPRGSVKSQGFHGPYQAQDLAAATGTSIVASSAGRVIAVRHGWSGGYGEMVIIDDGIANVLYAHMSEINVNQGQVIAQGELVGKVGSTGRSTGPHLHIEYRGKKGPMKTPIW